MDPAWLPRITSPLPVSGGAVKHEPSDFEVEELPAYLPSGEGEHLYLWVEKVGHDTQWVVERLACALGVDPREIGCAGLKDRQAVTRQLLSVPARAEARLEAFAAEGVRILWTRRHGNKLRTGHLRGNRFRIRVRQVKDAAAGIAAFEALCRRGLPNGFGPQRFGVEGQNARFGKKLLRSERLPKRPDRFARRLYLSAYQAALFNRVLAARIEAGRFERTCEGDWMVRLDSGGQFPCTDPEVDQARMERFEVSPTGPLFGPKMPRPSGEAGRVEQAVLAEEGLTLEDFRRGRGETEGTRRALRVPLREALIEPDGQDLLLSFVLPAGSYATRVLDEVVGRAV